MQLFDRTLGQWLEHWAEETPDKEIYRIFRPQSSIYLEPIESSRR